MARAQVWRWTLTFALAPLALGFTAGSALADNAAVAAETEAPGAPDEFTYASRKRTILEAKSSTIDTSAVAGASAAEYKRRWQRELDRRTGKTPGAVINIYNTWTHEYLVVDAGPVTINGSDDSAALVAADAVDRFLRCHYTNQPTSMDPRLIRVLIAAAQHFGTDRVDIVSGFRSPKYNRVLRKKGREVSRKSQHPQGTAVDFRLPGIPVTRLHAWAKSLRLGGLGFYPHSGFIHVDTARVRYWTGR